MQWKAAGPFGYNRATGVLQAVAQKPGAPDVFFRPAFAHINR
jgi:hypothetical protein